MTSFATGMAHMQSAIEEGKRKAAAARSGGGGSLGYINWKPGDQKVLRFLTDDVLTENFVEFIVDNTGETKNFMIPPADPNILDRYRVPEGVAGYPIGWRRNPKTQKIEDPKPRKIGVGIAVLRKHPDTPGGQVEDYLYDQEIEGTNYLSRTFGIVQQSVSNFWHTLAVSCFKLYGTICDRDYLIERTGEGLDTKYSIIPLNPDPDLDTVQKVQQFYFYGNQWNPEDPERFLKCPQTLTQWAEYFSGEERFKHWLTPGGSPNNKQQATPAQPQQPSYSPQPQTVMDPMHGASEFHPATTHNTPEIAQQTTGTSFSSFKDDLLKKAQGGQ